jgi:DNA-binding CsgD family transcriptional regulator
VQLPEDGFGRLYDRGCRLESPKTPVRLKPIYDGDTLVAALVRSVRPPAVTLRPDRLTFGWASPTGAELSLVELIASRLTNHDASEKLCLSHHTVDSHRRHILRKLDITSRVELAGLFASKQTSAAVPPTTF